MSICTVEATEQIQNTISAHPAVTVAYTRRSTLGGEASAAILVCVCLDPKESWANGIMENSRYARFSIDNGRIECFINNTSTKFRASKIKDINHAIQRINQWLEKVA